MNEAVPYAFEDPQNLVRWWAVECVACGMFDDLVPRGDVFLCRDTLDCRERERIYPAPEVLTTVGR